MKTSLVLIVGVVMILRANAQDDIEPQPIFIIETEAETSLLTEGETFTIEASSRDTEVEVRLAPYRKFNNAALAFRYPSNFAFEYDESPGYKSWTLDGNNFVILLFEIDNQTALEDFVDEIVDQFGRENCSLQETEVPIGLKTLYGTRIMVEMAGQGLTFDFLKIPSEDGKSWFIAFQDSLNDDGSGTEEAAITLEMIDQSIVYKEDQ